MEPDLINAVVPRLHNEPHTSGGNGEHKKLLSKSQTDKNGRGGTLQSDQLSTNHEKTIPHYH